MGSTAPEAPPMPGGEMGDAVQKPDYIVREEDFEALPTED